MFDVGKEVLSFAMILMVFRDGELVIGKERMYE